MAAIINTKLFRDASFLAYYRFEGNSNDSKGSANGSDTDVTYSALSSHYLQSAAYNGSSSRTSITGSTLTDFTICAWFRLNGTSGSSQVLENFSNATDNGNADIYIETSSNAIRASLWNGTAGTNITSTVSVNDGKWHHVASTRVSTTLNLYLDGKLVATDGAAITVTIGSRWELGRNLPNNNSYANISIDDLGVFSRGLTQSEIALLAGSAAPLMMGIGA